MSNRVRTDAALRGVEAYQKALDKLAAGRNRIKKSEIADPFLADVARDRTVTTGCSNAAKYYASVNKMKKALEVVGATMASIDSNRDGEIGYGEAQRLSPLGVRLLDAVAEGKVPRTRARHRAHTATSPQPVSSHC
ncbi:MAG: hypothetical protein JXR83_13625 [Deltaproteobacteria bacterium]|nr:hypothetical protein [Deltaproteobacteria bacterium]